MILTPPAPSGPGTHHPARDRIARLEDLSGREREVLAFVAMGVDDKAIADLLSMSHRTVRAHISSLFRKLRVHNRTEAALAGQLSHLLTCEACARWLARTAGLGTRTEEAP